MGLDLRQTTDAQFGEDVLDVEGTILVDFWSPDEPATRQQSPALERFARTHPDVRVLRHNTLDNPGIPGQLGITTVPTLVVFKDGLPLVGAAGVLDDRGLDRLLSEADARLAAIPTA